MEEVFKVIKDCCREIAYLIRISETEFLGSVTKHTNHSGDHVKKLDELTNNLLLDKLRACPQVRQIASEELPDIINTPHTLAPYFVSFDPLDGSSNIDVNITVGTIFTVFEYDQEGSIKDGNNIVLAGYCLYGGSTQMVVATPQNKVEMFSLIPKYDDFILIDSELEIPSQGKIYAINESNKNRWNQREQLTALINHLIDLGYTQRWVASLVADAHRTLIKGGFFSYPGDNKNPRGKIRLLYEAYPMAFIFQQAGGVATDGGYKSLLEQPFPHQEIHLKTPIFLSSPTEYQLYLS